MDHKLVVVGLLFAGTYALIRMGLYFGYRWVDRMLHFEPLDPKKPIVRRTP